MPGKGRNRRFINKKNAVTFSVVHRSQRDPLQADEEAPKHVLLPYADRRKEQVKYGVYYEDDYDYMQHLREVDELHDVNTLEVNPFAGRHDDKEEDGVVKVSKDGNVEWEETEDDKEEVIRIQRGDPALVLPSTVFASKGETKIGLLNKAAPSRGPKLDWDPDVVAALDDDFDFSDEENLLEDDFIAMANKSGDEDDEEEMEHGAGNLGGELNMDSDVDSNAADLSDVGSNFSGYCDEMDDPFAAEETKSRFTAYSMSSSVMKRNKGLTLVDDRMEKFYENYDEDKIGYCIEEEDEDVDKVPDAENPLLLEALREMEESQLDCKLKNGDKAVLQVISTDEESEEEMVDVQTEDPKPQWDCESILSTYSNKYNHPKILDPPKPKVDHIKLTSRVAIPADVLPKRGLTNRQIEQMNQQTREKLVVSVPRPKNETKEEKKARKSAVKNERRIRRDEKKMNKQMFKDERRRQEKDLYNVQQNMQGVKIT